MQSEGEDAGVSAAAKAGIPFALSSMGTRTIEDLKNSGQIIAPWLEDDHENAEA